MLDFKYNIAKKNNNYFETYKEAYYSLVYDCIVTSSLTGIDNLWNNYRFLKIKNINNNDYQNNYLRLLDAVRSSNPSKISEKIPFYKNINDIIENTFGISLIQNKIVLKENKEIKYFDTLPIFQYYVISKENNRIEIKKENHNFFLNLISSFHCVQQNAHFNLLFLIDMKNNIATETINSIAGTPIEYPSPVFVCQLDNSFCVKENLEISEKVLQFLVK